MAGERTYQREWWLRLALLVSVLGLRASAQINQLIPEIDVYYKLHPDVRVNFQAKETREGGDPTQAEIGPSIEFYLKPLVKLKKIAYLELDDSKPRPLVFAIGYRYLPSPNSPQVNRFEPVVTFHYPLRVGVTPRSTLGAYFRSASSLSLTLITNIRTTRARVQISN